MRRPSFIFGEGRTSRQRSFGRSRKKRTDERVRRQGYQPQACAAGDKVSRPSGKSRAETFCTYPLSPTPVVADVKEISPALKTIRQDQMTKFLQTDRIR